jgi:signal transduction histidine kinase
VTSPNRLRQHQLSLRARAVLLSGILVVVAIFAVIGVVYLDVRASSNYLLADQAQTRRLDLASLVAGMDDEKAGLEGYVATSDIRFIELEPNSPDLPALFEKIRSESSAGDQSDLQRLGLTMAAWRSWDAAVKADVLAGNPTPEPQTSLTGKSFFDPFLAAYAAVEADAVDDAAAALSLAKLQTQQQANWTLIAGVVCIGMLLVLVGLFIRSTLTPIRRLVVTAAALAAAKPVAIPGLLRRDEVGDLARALESWRAGEGNRLLLSTAMAEVSSEVDRARILEAAVPRLLALFEAKEVVISLVETGSPIIVVSEPNRFVPVGNPLNPNSPGQRAMATGQAIVTDLRRPEWDTELLRWGLGPALAMPLMSRGRVLGVATVLRGVESPAFEEADLHQAEVAAPFVAAAIDAASLFHNLETANVQLERASRLKSEFLANMSHELRTPLNAILGFSQLLMQKHENGSADEREVRYVSNIHTSGTHLLGLVSEILDLAQIEAGRAELHKTMVMLDNLVEITIAGLEPLAMTNGLHLTASVGAEIELQADYSRLQQILLNVLSNAIKFTPPGGEVRVTAETTAEEVTISVRDTGCGIPKEDQARVFEKFEQVAGGRMRAAEGTGLGLALTKALVELHGGTIGLESEPGKGTTVSVTLPLRLGVDVPIQPSTPAAAA